MADTQPLIPRKRRGASNHLSPPPPPPAMATLLLFLHLSALLLLPSAAQQPYTGNLVLDCYNTNGSSTLGYSCASSAAAQPACQSYLLFRSTAPYQSPVSIAYLLNSSAPSISDLNSAVDVLTLPATTPVLVPVPCSCSSSSGRGGPSYYQHSTNYTLKWKTETYMVVGTTTFQGLSACQAMMAQNPAHDSRQLLVGMELRVPLRCACPSRNQTLAGYKYLLTYPVVEGDDVSQIAARFGVDEQEVLDANQLAPNDIIFPLTTLLVPLKKAPTKDQLAVSPAASPPTATMAPSPGGSNKKWIVVGVVVGVAVVALLGLLALFVVLRRLRKRQIQDGERPSGDYTGFSDKPATVLPPPPSSMLSDEVRRLIGSLKTYTYEDLEKATGSFSKDNRIKGSVYRAIINGCPAAVKILKGDSANEINILKQTNHTNLIRLSGLCLYRNNTYLVFEFAENGSLDDWLHHDRVAAGNPDPDSCCLSWKTRVQIAYDVADGLNYLHNYTSPGSLHMELNSSNILLDGEFRAKLTNFGRSRPVTDDTQSMPQQTRHVVGTQGYLPPEYLEHGLITPKLDVFAFGVVLLELLSGKEALFSKSGSGGGGKAEAVMLSGAIGEVLRGEDVREKLKAFLDPCLGSDYPLDSVFNLAQLAERCVAKEAASRPSVAELFVALSAVQSAVLDWDPSSERSDSMPHSFGR